jgi:hypothetical protein
MAKFDAGKTVEVLEYDFTTVPGGEGKGTIPEPSDKDMQKFQKTFLEIRKAMGKIEKEASEIEGDLTDEQEASFEKRGKEISAQMDEAVAKLCKDRPSVEQMSSLPYRHKLAFASWLMNEFSPEGAASGTKS